MIKYMIPTQPHEIRMQEAVIYGATLETEKPKVLKDYDTTSIGERRKFWANVKTKQLRGVESFLRQFLCYWSNMPAQGAKDFSFVALLDAYNKVNNCLYTPLQRVDSFTLFGTEWHTPIEDMKESIFFQFVECDEKQTRTHDEGLSLLTYLPFLCAILLRQKGESLFLNDKQVELREKAFMNVPLHVGLVCITILEETKQSIKTRFGKTLYSKLSSKERKAGAKNLQKGFGWYLTIKSLAEAQIFNLSGYTAIDSVQRANLWECLTYLSAQNAQSAYQDRYYKLNE